LNLFPALQTILYTISTALLYPVVILLVILCLWMLIYTGGFIAECIKRKQFRTNGKLTDSLEVIQTEQKLPQAMAENLPVHITHYSRNLGKIIGEQSRFEDEKVEDLNQQKHYSLLREVDKIRLIVRIGPSLGLMGTLIPMGTGLAGLTRGDMAQLSSSLILAFTTTVVGLALGITAHFFSVAKERWAIEDMRYINLITEAMMKKTEPMAKKGQPL
jgi:biopolymer transport protein ExbB/TolQ